MLLRNGVRIFYFNYWAQLASNSGVRKRFGRDSPLRSDWIELKCKNDLLTRLNGTMMMYYLC